MSRWFAFPRLTGPTGRRRWPLVLAYLALAVSCDNPLAPSVLHIGRIQVRPASAELAIGGSQTFTADVFDLSDSPVTSQKLFWSSEDPSVATVDQQGVVTAIGPGTVSIAASTGGRSGVAVVVVLAPAGGVSIAVSPDSVIAPGSVGGTAVVRDANQQPLPQRPVTLVSSNEAVATVAPAVAVTDDNGIVAFSVAGVSAGNASVLAISEGKNGAFPVRVLNGVSAMTVSAPGDSVIGTGTLQATAVLRDAAGTVLTGRPVTWSSSSAAVATVNPASGLITGVAPGTVTITAACEGVTRDLAIRVLPRVDAVQVSAVTATVHVGAAYARQFSAANLDRDGNVLVGRPVVWSSDDPSLATVDPATGVVTGLAPGTVQIHAASEGIQGTVSVLVDLVPVDSVALQPPSATIVPPGTQQFNATPFDSAANAITGPALGARPTMWQSSNPAAATVSASGVVTGIAQGSATITATIGGTAGAAAITVTSVPVASVTVTPSPASVTVGQTAQLTATAFDATLHPLAGRTFTWSSSAPAIVTVDNTGTITGVAVGGPVTVTATAGGKTGASQVTVIAIPATQLGITVQPSATAASGMLLGQQPQVQLLNATGGPVAQAGVAVTAAIASGGGVLSGGPTATTDASGLASFTDLAITGPAGPYTLSFSAPALTSVTSGTIVLGAGGPSQLAITTPPSTTAQSGVALSQQPAVSLRDASNNPVLQSGIVVTASVVGTGGTLGGTVSVATDAAGVATFTNLAISGPVPGPYSLTFSASGLTSASSAGITLSAGPASRLAITTQPSTTAASGTPFTRQPVIQLQDAAGNPVSQDGVAVTAAITGGGATLNGSTIATTSAGVATFTNLAITGPSGSYTLTFTSGTLTAAVSGTITLGAGAATQLAIVTQPSTTAQNGVPFGTQPIIQLRDASNNAVSQSGVPVTAAITGGGAALDTTLTVSTDASGVATFTNLTITGLTGSYTLTFTSGVLSAAVSNAIALGPGAATQLVFSTAPPSTASSGAALAPQPVVQLQDASGNSVPQSGVAVTASISPAGASLSGAVITTDITGAATYSALTITGTAGSYSLTFSAGGLTPVSSGAITLSAGTGSRLAIVQQPSDTAPNGAVFARQPVVQLRDASNNPVLQSGVSITVAIASGSGTLGGTQSAITNASGVASFTNLKITGTVGARTLIFATGGYVSATSTTVTIIAGPAAALVISSQPSANATSGVLFGTQPVIQVSDVSGNPVAQSGVSVAAAITGGGATLNGTTPVSTNSNGTAAFTDLGISGPVGSYTLTFSAGGLPSVMSNTITLGAGAAAKLTITIQPPATAVSGTTFGQQPVIQLRDASNNPVSQGGVSVTAAITGGGATLTGTATVTTNSSGVATFTDLGITGSVGSYTLTFSSGALTTVQSGTISLTAGAATQLTITTPPSASATSGTAFAQQPVIQLRDASNNPVSQSGVSVTAAITGGGGGATLNGTATVSTNGSGVATFTDLGITGLAGSYTLTFSSGILAPAQSGTITLSGSSTPSQLTITTQPSTTATSGTVFAQQPAIQLRDAGGNPVSQSGVSVTAAITGGGGGATLNGTATISTSGSGLATFTDLGITGLAGSYTLTFSSGALATAQSNTITLSGSSTPSQLTITTQPSAAATSGTVFAQQPVIQLRDAGGNPVAQSGISVTAAIATGDPSASLNGTTTVTTSGSGVATFTDLGITGLAGSYTLTFTSGALASVQSNAITLSGSSTPTQLTLTTQPSASATNGSVFAQQPEIQLRDAGGNPVAQGGVTITVSITGGGATLNGKLTQNTTGSGLATFTNLGITGLAGTYTLTFQASGGGIASVISNSITLTAGAATQLLITTQPSPSATSGVVFAQQPVVQLADASGNAVSQGGVSVTASITGGGATLNGTATVSTNSSGAAIFTDLAITGPSGSYTLQFDSGTLTAATSATIVIP